MSSGVLKMRGGGFVVLFGLIACVAGGAVTPASAFDLREWQTAAGKPPSKHEFAAVVAACEDRIKRGDRSGPFEGCLADYGLRRLQ